MVGYLQALNNVRLIFQQFPEIKQLIKLELNNSEGTTNVEFYENKSNSPEPQSSGTISTDGTEPSGDLPHQSRSGNVHDRSTSDVQSTKAVEPEALSCDHQWSANGIQDTETRWNCTKCGINQ
jgi:hypothetical protein